MNLFLPILFISSLAHAGPPIIWGGSGAQLLTPAICFPDTTCVTSGSFSPGATTTLNNIASTAASASINPGTDSAFDLGTLTGPFRWRGAKFNGTIQNDGAIGAARFSTGTNATDNSITIGVPGSGGPFTLFGSFSTSDNLGTNQAPLLAKSYSTSGFDPIIMLARARGTNAAPLAVSSGNGLGTTFYNGYTGTSFEAAASIGAEADGTPSPTSMPGRINLRVTASGSLDPVIALRVHSSKISEFFGQVLSGISSTVSSPAQLMSGSWFSGGTSTTTKPHVLIEPTGTTSTGWNTSGTALGVNAASGFTGYLFDFQLNGATKFAMTPTLVASSVPFWTLAPGAASTPSLYFFGAPFTGGTSTTTKPFLLIEPSGATSTAWSTSGTELGVNATLGFTGNLFDFQQNATSRVALTAAGSMNSTGQFNVTASGNTLRFGAGTTPTDNPITVSGSANYASYSVSDDNDGNQGGFRVIRHQTNTQSGKLQFAKSRGTFAAPTIVSSGDTSGQIDFFGYDGVDYENTARIISTVDGTPGSNDMPGRLSFLVTPDGSVTPATAMSIAQDLSTGFFGAVTSTSTMTASSFVGTATGNTTISGQTNQGVVIASATNAMTSTGAGTSGQVLTSNGSAADPTYQSAPTPTLIGARYHGSATSISSTYATVSWTTADFDTNSAMSAGTFTVPSTGYYNVFFLVEVDGVFGAGSSVAAQIQKNGTVQSEFVNRTTGVAASEIAHGSDLVSVTSGDTIRLQLKSTAGTPTISATTDRVFIAISKLAS